jgi:hypothetical protein
VSTRESTVKPRRSSPDLRAFGLYVALAFAWAWAWPLASSDGLFNMATATTGTTDLMAGIVSGCVIVLGVIVSPRLRRTAAPRVACATGADN